MYVSMYVWILITICYEIYYLLSNINQYYISINFTLFSIVVTYILHSNKNKPSPISWPNAFFYI